MNISHALTSDVRYFLNLVRAAVDGASSARKDAAVPSVASRPVWVPAAVGAVVGASTIRLKQQSKTGYGLAVGGLIGSLLGLGCGFAWASRGFTASLARGAIQKANVVRDAHWLEMNPIDYA